MSDYINRADAIEAVMAESRKVYTSEYANAERIIHEADAVEALAMLPSAEAVQGWIPVSERLPSESGTYLVTTAKGAVWADHFYANSVDDRHWSYRTRRVPIAWMPMPKPYKGGDTE